MKHLLENQKRVFVALAIVMTSVIALIAVSLIGKNTIKQTKEAVVIEAGQELELQAEDFF